ncbi:MAG: hypothetical protein K6E50_09860 [Lachnospiraceae bacterium]|nr:hypothetical protein [Lachnospiraceae bacterium]
MNWNDKLSSYQSKSQKAEEAKSSAVALLIIGGCGLVIVLLWAFNLLPGNISIVRRFMLCGIIGLFSIVFLIMGFFSIRSSKRLRIGAKEEDKRTEEILKWARENLKKEVLDEKVLGEGEELEEEEKYFRRISLISACLNEKYMNLEADYAEDISEQIYQQTYDNASSDRGAIAS